MAAKDLITLSRAKQNIQSITDSSQDALLSTLVTAYSDAIEKYCRRRFVSTAYDELYDGNGDRRLLLRQYPVQSVQSVRYRPVTVAKVTNTDLVGNQQARAQVTATGLQLSRVSSAIKITESLLTWSAYPMLYQLMDAATGLGSGWQGQIVGDAAQQVGQQGDYGKWPSEDLYCPNSYGDPLEGTGIQTSQGALDCRGCFAELKLHTYELQGYQWDARGWLLRAIPYNDPELLHPEDFIWPIGVNNFRVQYTAGYSTVPEAVQEACALWVAMAYSQTQRDPSLSQQAMPGAISQSWVQQDPKNPPPRVRVLLAPYRRYTISTEQG